MREILFRGKCKIDGGWVYGCIFRNKEKTELLIRTDTDDYPIKLDSLGQYTGLKDKNGTKIFEGDIVIFTDECDYPHWFKRNDKILVKWDDITSRFSPYVEYDSDCGEFVNGGETEIIGNIYDNPELLKGE